MHTDDEIFHLVRIADRLETDEVKKAFFLLVTEFYRKYGDILRPASQGAFSVLQVRPNGTNYFAFKGAKERIRFYFRKPFFVDNSSNYNDVLRNFSWSEEVQQGEIAVNVRTTVEAKQMIAFIGKYI